MKFLGIEKGKKNKTNLLFVAGDRVRQYLGRSYQVEKSLMGILKYVVIYIVIIFFLKFF